MKPPEGESQFVVGSNGTQGVGKDGTIPPPYRRPQRSLASRQRVDEKNWRRRDGGNQQ